MKSKPVNETDALRKPSREEIESLCILHAIARGPGDDAQLATCLGLSADLAPAIGEAVRQLVDAGWIEGETRCLTEAGRRWLEAGTR